jgi:hypothetical protein
MQRMCLQVVGDSQFVAIAGDVNLGPAGDVRLGTFSADGVNVTLEEDDSTQLLTIDATGDLRVTSVSTLLIIHVRRSELLGMQRSTALR